MKQSILTFAVVTVCSLFLVGCGNDEDKQIEQLRRQNKNLAENVGRLEEKNAFFESARDEFAKTVELLKKKVGLVEKQRDEFARQRDQITVEFQNLQDDTGCRFPMKPKETFVVEANQPANPVNGIVLKADAVPQELVVISVGSDGGIKVGTRFTVYRVDAEGKAKYIGLVKAFRVEKEFCVCKIDKDMRARDKKNKPIPFKKGDRATTEIPAMDDK